MLPLFHLLVQLFLVWMVFHSNSISIWFRFTWLCFLLFINRCNRWCKILCCIDTPNCFLFCFRHCIICKLNIDWRWWCLKIRLFIWHTSKWCNYNKKFFPKLDSSSSRSLTYIICCYWRCFCVICCWTWIILISKDIIMHIIFLFRIWCWCKNKCLNKTFRSRCLIICDWCRGNFSTNLYNNRWTDRWMTINLTNLNMPLF